MAADTTHRTWLPRHRPTVRFLLAHPAHWIALGFGAGLSPLAPGTVGTLWAWVAFLVFDRWLDAIGWGVVIAGGTVVGVWACLRTARDIGVADPRAIVWDEVLAFWCVLWLVMPVGFAGQLAAFVIFRAFDMAKPGPIAWLDRAFKQRAPGQPIGWRQGVGIVADDFAAALATLVAIALWLRA